MPALDDVPIYGRFPAARFARIFVCLCLFFMTAYYFWMSISAISNISSFLISLVQAEKMFSCGG